MSDVINYVIKQQYNIGILLCLLCVWDVSTGQVIGQTEIINKTSDSSNILKEKPTTNQFAKIKSPDSMYKRISSVNIDSLAKGVFDYPIVHRGPFIKFTGGLVAYNMNYRSAIDTPFAEKNILQHTAYGNIKLSVGQMPLKINYLIRRSNSQLFRDINDVQVEFDVTKFNGLYRQRLKDKLLALEKYFKDSLLELNYKVNQSKLKKTNDSLDNPSRVQKLIEYNEILKVSGITNDYSQSDSVNKIKANKLKKEAQLFVDSYNKQNEQRGMLKKQVDSLEDRYNGLIKKIKAYQSLVNQKLNSPGSANGLQDSLKNYGINEPVIPKKYLWLLNVRKLAIGRNPVNYSELTTKDISLTGINFEYSSWYYFAIAAGLIDYRFQDFVINPGSHSPQYMYMMRLGIGKPENNHFILSLYKGQKQLYAVTNTTSGSSSIRITGFSAEGKWRFNANSYLLAEAAQSLSPDFRKIPMATEKFNFNDGSNKGLSLKIYSFLPRTSSIIDAMYKYTGANFQSFSSFQTNSASKAWHIKVNQWFLHKKLMLSVALRNDEFSNPYIVQNYQSTTVFKSIQATYKSRNFPTITVGYVPTSQITSVDSQFVENRFYSFNVGITHSYKIGERRATSAFIYNRFYNHQSDSGFLYYNAENIFFNQTILFGSYTTNLSLSHSISSDFELNTLDAGLLFPLTSYCTIGFGVKVNSYDKAATHTGGYGNVHFNIKKIGVLSVAYDQGYIPGSYHRLVRNDMLNLNFTRAL